MKRLTYILIGIFLFSFAWAQEDLTIYLKLAGENNPTLQAKYKMYLAALETVDEQGSLPDPTVSFGYFISPVETRVGAQRFKVSLSQMFPWIGTIQTKKEAATLLAKAKFEDFMNAKNQLYYQVKNQWLAIYTLEKKIRINKENLDILRSFEAVTKTKYEANLVSLSDLVRVQIQIDEVKTKIDLLVLERKPLLSNFNTLLNRGPMSEVDVPETLDARFEDFVSLDEIKDDQPQIKAFQYQIEASDKQIRLADLRRKPNIGLGLDYGFIAKRENLAIEDNGKDILMPMVSLSLPIFQKKNKAYKRGAQLHKEYLKLQLTAYENQLENRLVEALTHLKSLETQLAQYERELQQTNLLLKVLTTEYSNDNTQFEELLRTQQQLLQLQLAQVKTEKDVHDAIAKLDLLTTKTLKIFP